MSTTASAGCDTQEAGVQALWASGAALLWLDEAFALVRFNAAAGSLLHRVPGTAAGLPLTAWMPAAEHDSWLSQVADLRSSAAPWPVLRARLLDGAGHERWLVFTPVRVQAEPAGWLMLLHDDSQEQSARAQARRAEDEMAQWFELSGAGMVVVDGTGLIVRANAAFETLVPRLPEVLQQAAPELQRLLGWQGEGLDPDLQPGRPPLERQVLMPMADGRRRRLWSRLSCQAGEGGAHRVRAVVQDRSAEDERDIAQLEMGMLMDTASVRVATYDPSRGWLGGGDAAGAGGQPGEGDALHVGIRSDLVASHSRADFERLQAALRTGQPAQERYAVSHPQLGMRWLLTRVEPAQLRGGGQTMSVVTLDITEEERALRRNEQLLRELTVILDSSTAGIAYLRGPVLVRCNRRFERMLGFEPGAAAGASLQEILGRGIGPLDGVREALEALAAGRPFEAELPLVQADGVPHWYSLSVRRADGADQQGEAVAVLTDITRLKAQQAQLEQLLRDRDLMFNLSEVGIVYQRGARIERANQAMAELTGWAGPELGTLDVAELYESARDCVDFEARVQQALREGGRFVGERRLRRRDGRLIWVQVAVRPVDADDAEAGLICSFVDIDERRRARETLSQQAERTRAVLNSVLVGIVSVSDRGIEWMNRSARRMFGGELADFVGEPISTVATPEPDHPLRRSDWLMRLKEGQAESFECRLRGRDGREFWVVGNAVLTGPGGAGADEAGEVTFALLDIERRRQAEVSIAAAQASLQRVIETAPLAIALFDARTLRVQQANQTAGTFFGRPADELLGTVPETCCPPAKAQALRQWLTGVASGDGPRQVEWRDEPAVADSGAATVWDCRLAPLSDGSGQATQLLLVASDVTEQRAAELARLQAAIAQREVLVREVHHRIKNNLQGVAGLLQQNAQRHPELAVLLGEAVGQVHAIAQVYGLQVGSQGPLAVAGLLRAIAGSVQRTFGRGIHVELEGDVPHELPEAEAIPVALTLNELMTNAIKHGQGGDVRCTLAVRGDEVSLSVSGSGRLPPGFDLGTLRGGLSGLGLVRALLPRRSAGFELVQQGDDVAARVTLRPPSVRLPAPVDR
jgi:PAS domain S-box-containing protein